MGFDSKFDSRADLTAEESVIDPSSTYSSPLIVVNFATTRIPTSISEEEFNQTYQKLQNQSIEILKTFIMKNAACDINLPDSMRQQISTSLENSIHPEIFVQAIEHIRRNMRNGVFIRFMKHNDASFTTPISIPKYTIHQIVANECPAPYSYKNFYEYLQVQVKILFI